MGGNDEDMMGDPGSSGEPINEEKQLATGGVMLHQAPPDDEDQHQGIIQNTIPLLRQANHPGVCFFHAIFKLFTILCYLLLNLIIDSDIMTFIVVILLLSFDFWTVKNITGRKLVGLKWSNEIAPNGDNLWTFDSINQKKEANFDTRYFWIVLYIFPVFWILMFILKLLTLSIFWVTLCIVGLVLSGSNAYGYFKCDQEQTKKLKGMINDQIKKRAWGALTGGF